MLAALLLSTAVSVLNNTNRMYESMHDQSHGAHQILRMENGIHDPIQVHNWWEKQKGVIVSDLMRYRYLSSMSHAGEEIPNVDLFMMDAPSGPFPVDRPQFVEGEEKAHRKKEAPGFPPLWLIPMIFMLGIRLNLRRTKGLSS